MQCRIVLAGFIVSNIATCLCLEDVTESVETEEDELNIVGIVLAALGFVVMVTVLIVAAVIACRKGLCPPCRSINGQKNAVTSEEVVEDNYNKIDESQIDGIKHESTYLEPANVYVDVAPPGTKNIGQNEREVYEPGYAEAYAGRMHPLSRGISPRRIAASFYDDIERGEKEEDEYYTDVVNPQKNLPKNITSKSDRSHTVSQPQPKKSNPKFKKRKTNTIPDYTNTRHKEDGDIQPMVQYTGPYIPMNMNSAKLKKAAHGHTNNVTSENYTNVPTVNDGILAERRGDTKQIRDNYDDVVSPGGSLKGQLTYVNDRERLERINEQNDIEQISYDDVVSSGGLLKEQLSHVDIPEGKIKNEQNEQYTNVDTISLPDSYTDLVQNRNAEGIQCYTNIKPEEEGEYTDVSINAHESYEVVNDAQGSARKQSQTRQNKKQHNTDGIRGPNNRQSMPGNYHNQRREARHDFSYDDVIVKKVEDFWSSAPELHTMGGNQFSLLTNNHERTKQEKHGAGFALPVLTELNNKINQNRNHNKTDQKLDHEVNHNRNKIDQNNTKIDKIPPIPTYENNYLKEKPIPAKKPKPLPKPSNNLKDEPPKLHPRKAGGGVENKAFTNTEHQFHAD